MKKFLLLCIPLLTFAGAISPLEYVQVMGKSPIVGGGGGSLTPDLLWVKFNDGSGSTAAATVGNNYTTSGTWVSGAGGGALQFGNTLQTRMLGQLNPNTNKITITYWYKAYRTNAVNIIQEQSPTFYNNNGSWVLSWEDGVMVSSFYYAGSGTEGKSFPTYSAWTNIWIHYAWTIDGSSVPAVLRCWTNGIEHTALTTDNSSVGVGTTLNSYTNYLGYRGASGGSLYAEGAIDDLRIYSGNLTGTQISDIKNDPQ